MKVQEKKEKAGFLQRFLMQSSCAIFLVFPRIGSAVAHQFPARAMASLFLWNKEVVTDLTCGPQSSFYI